MSSTFDIPKKSLGQHWLNDQDSLYAMVEAADIGLDDEVLEIGPGPGSLTEILVASAKHVTAVEFDEQLAAKLPDRIDADNLTVVQSDILSFDLTKLSQGFKVVANIPYYLTSNLLRTLCESSNHFDQAAILIQKEVAERVCAKPGAMSLLSVSVQFYCHASLGRLVPAALFTPPPKVDSKILQLRYRKQLLFPDVDTKVFFRLVRAGFSQRRKTVLNSLSAGLNLSRTETFDLLAAANISQTDRAQALTLDQWHDLYLQYVDTKS